MSDLVRFLMAAALLVWVWPTSAEDLPAPSQDLLDTAKAKVAAGKAQEAVGLLRQVLHQLPPEDSASKDARILFCQLRADAAEAPSALSFEGSRGEGPRDSRPPQRLLAPEPKVEQNGCLFVQGMVLVEVIIDQDGCVANLRLLKGTSTVADEAALATLKNWVYLPALADGQAVPGRVLEVGKVSPGPQLSFSFERTNPRGQENSSSARETMMSPGPLM